MEMKNDAMRDSKSQEPWGRRLGFGLAPFWVGRARARVASFPSLLLFSFLIYPCVSTWTPPVFLPCHARYYDVFVCVIPLVRTCMLITSRTLVSTYRTTSHASRTLVRIAPVVTLLYPPRYEKCPPFSFGPPRKFDR
jgi:hypothetical protein